MVPPLNPWSNSRSRVPFRPSVWVLEDMSKALQVKVYSSDDRDLACPEKHVLFGLLEGKLHGLVVYEPTYTALNSEYGTATGFPMLFKQSGDRTLEYVSNVDKRVTFVCKDVHFINLECAADGTWSLSSEALTTIAQGLYTRKVHAYIVALRLYAGMQPTPAVPRMKEGQHECRYCHMSVKGKDLIQHMAFHIGRGEAKGAMSPLPLFGAH